MVETERQYLDAVKLYRTAMNGDLPPLATLKHIGFVTLLLLPVNIKLHIKMYWDVEL